MPYFGSPESEIGLQAARIENAPGMSPVEGKAEAICVTEVTVADPKRTSGSI